MLFKSLSLQQTFPSCKSGCSAVTPQFTRHRLIAGAVSTCAALLIAALPFANGWAQSTDISSLEAYVDAIKQPRIQDQIGAMEHFLHVSGQSTLRLDALEILVVDYQKMNNPERAVARAHDLLNVDPSNPLAIAVLNDEGAPSATRKGRNDEFSAARRGLGNVDRLHKPEGMGQAQFVQLQQKIRGMLAGAIGMGYLDQQDYEKATNYLRQAVTADPGSARYNYGLAQALLSGSGGGTADAYWLMAKAVNLAKGTPKEQQIARDALRKYRENGGSEAVWNQLLAAAAASTPNAAQANGAQAAGNGQSAESTPTSSAPSQASTSNNSKNNAATSNTSTGNPEPPNRASGVGSPAASPANSAPSMTLTITSPAGSSANGNSANGGATANQTTTSGTQPSATQPSVNQPVNNAPVASSPTADQNSIAPATQGSTNVTPSRNAANTQVSNPMSPTASTGTSGATAPSLNAASANQAYANPAPANSSPTSRSSSTPSSSTPSSSSLSSSNTSSNSPSSNTSSAPSSNNLTSSTPASNPSPSNPGSSNPGLSNSPGTNLPVTDQPAANSPPIAANRSSNGSRPQNAPQTTLPHNTATIANASPPALPGNATNLPESDQPILVTRPPLTSSTPVGPTTAPLPDRKPAVQPPPVVTSPIMTAPTGPVSLGILIQTELLDGNNREPILDAMREMARNLRPGDEAFVMAFSDQLDFEQDLTANDELLEEGLQNLRAKPGAALFEGMTFAIQHLKRIGKNGNRVLLIISDGRNVPSATGQQHLDADVSRVRIDCIGLDVEHALDRQNLQKLAYWSGGMTSFVNDPEQIRTAASAMARTIIGEGFANR